MTKMPHLAALEWDFADRLQHVDKGGGGHVYFTYNAGGERVRKVWVHSGLIEERIYLGGFEIYRRRLDAPVSTVELERKTLHLLDEARRVAMVETKTIDTVDGGTDIPRWRFQLDNHLGSAAVETDETSSVISYEEYHPHGSTALHTAQGGAEVSAKRYRYTGKERDEETGLYYHGARYYAPWLGRWTATDPLGVSQPAQEDLNLYAYVSGRVLNASDPTGTGLFDAIVESVKTGDFSPSSPFAQELVHGDFFGSSVLQDDKKLETAQHIATGVAIVAGSIATGGLVAEGLTAAGAGTLTTGALSSVAGGATTRAAQTVVGGGSATDALKAAADPKAVLVDAAAGGAITKVAQVAGKAIPKLIDKVRGARAPAPKPTLSPAPAEPGLAPAPSAAAGPKAPAAPAKPSLVGGKPAATKPTSSAAEQPRDALGRFAPKTGGEVTPGKPFQEAVENVVKEFADPGTFGRQIQISPTGGGRRPIIDVGARLGGRHVLFEAKSGTAGLREAQRAAFPRIRTGGGTVVSRGSPRAFPRGSGIGPARVRIIREQSGDLQKLRTALQRLERLHQRRP